MLDPVNEQAEKPSKTRRKKEMIALQKLGETLVNLPKSQLAKIPVPDELLEAVTVARSLKDHEAKRRQFQYIGKIMREIDPEPIKAALRKIESNSEANTVQFHQAEQWREKLIANGDDALQELLGIYPQLDRQTMRQLIRKAQYDRAHTKNSGAATMLFRCVRELLDN